MNRAECPVAKLDFVNLVASFGGVGSATQPQPTNRALVDEGAVRLDDSLLVNSRALVDEVLRNPGVFSSEDLIEQGNTLPLIPLGIDPPAHVRYRKLLDPLFAPRPIPVYTLSPGYEVTYLPSLRSVPDLQLSWPT